MTDVKPRGRRRNSALFGALLAALIAAVVGAGSAEAAVCSTGAVTFSATGSEQCYSVPAGVTKLRVAAIGGPGSRNFIGAGSTSGGVGASVTATVAVTPGQILYVEVGGAGTISGGGFNGGGNGATSSSGGGGGATDLRTCSRSAGSCPEGSTLASRLLVAGGGGGAGGKGASSATSGGSGGQGNQIGAVGSPGSAGISSGGGGGTQSAGGTGGTSATACGSVTAASGGDLGLGGNGAFIVGADASGGGGGGGYYGGGGGGTGCNTTGSGGGGGGGSSFSTDPNALFSPASTGTPSLTIKPQPSLATTATASATLGEPISDSATLSGGDNPTGTMIFQAYGPNDATCSSIPAYQSGPLTVNGNGVYGLGTFTPTQAGTYRWIVSYSGDANNESVSGSCNDPDETSTVAKATPTLSTQATPSANLGSPISDTASLSNGLSPTGTVTFNAYGPNDPNCTGAPAFTATDVPLAGGMASSGSFTPTQPGSYRWIADYGGDANNNNVSGLCNDPNETSRVEAPSVANNDSATVLEDSGANPINVRANDTDADGPLENILSASSPTHGTTVVVNAGTGVTYTPTPDYCGADSFSYTLAGGDSATVSVTVTCLPEPDTTAPQTTITKHPKARVVTRRARGTVTFGFKSSEAGSHFACKLDGQSFRPCTAPKTYRLKPGRHTFRVQAIDRAGNKDDTPAKFVVRVIRKR